MFRLRFLGLAALLAIPLAPAAAQASTPSPIVFAADRAPSVTGDIYRLSPDGHLVNLTHSPNQDTRPLVSPDGKTIAFLSQRGNTVSVYEMGIDGRGLVRVGPSLSPQGQYPYLAWQPRGNRIALTGGGSSLRTSLWILRAGHRPIPVPRSGDPTLPSWSPDGHVVLVYSYGRRVARAFSATGRPVFSISAAKPFSSWSSSGLVAIETATGVGVHDESGHLRFRVQGQSSGGPAWSPNGQLLAALVGGKLEVLTQTGSVVLRKPVSGDHGLVWDGNGRVVLGGFSPCQCMARSVDIRTGAVSSASDNWFAPRSADGKFAILTSRSGSEFALRVAPARGGSGKTYGHVPACWEDMAEVASADSLQFVGRGRSLVYESWGFCDPPFSNLYSSAQDGSGLHRITNTQGQETQPAVSPDGSEIAYVWAQLTGLSCAGCSDGIRLVDADGTALRTLTNPQNCTFDDPPTWSPDGSTILFAETTCDSGGELFTVPAGGGHPHDLGILGSEPAWGPSRIAYVGSDQSHRGLWTANPDGSDPVKLATVGSQPAWSFDGRLAYLLGQGGTTVVVGSTQTKLPFAQVVSLAWSPDGTRFVVTARKTKTATPDVFTVKTDGTDPVRLTTNYDALGAT